MTKAQIIRVALLLVLAAALIVVNQGTPRHEPFWEPIMRIVFGAIILMPVARWTGVWR